MKTKMASKVTHSTTTVRIVAEGAEADELQKAEFARMWQEFGRRAREAGMTEADATREVERDRPGNSGN